MLPSSTKGEDNIPSDFTVRLPNVLDLSEGEWTVGMSSIIYPGSFYGDDKQDLWVEILYFDVLGRENTKKINIPDTVFKSVHGVEKTINETLFGRPIQSDKSRPKRQTDQEDPPLSDEDIKKLNSARWWITGLTADINNSKESILSMYNHSRDLIHSAKSKEMPKNDERPKIVRDGLLKEMEKFETLINTVNKETDEANHLNSQGMSAFTAKNVKEARKSIQPLKDIKKRFMEGTDETQAYFLLSQAYKNKILSESRHLDEMLTEVFQLSVDEKKRLDTAKRWAEMLINEIGESMNTIDQLVDESEGLVGKPKRLTSPDKLMEDMLDNELTKIKNVKKLADNDATEAGNAHTSALDAYAENRVQDAQRNADILKRIKEQFMSDNGYQKTTLGHRNKIFTNVEKLLRTLSPEQKAIEEDREVKKNISKEVEELSKKYKFLGKEIQRKVNLIDNESETIISRMKTVIRDKPVYEIRNKLETLLSNTYRIPIDVDNKGLDAEEHKPKFDTFLGRIKEDLESEAVVAIISELDMTEGRALVDDLLKIDNFMNDEYKELKLNERQIDTLMKENEKKEAEYKKKENQTLTAKNIIVELMEEVNVEITKIEARTAVIEERVKFGTSKLPMTSEDIDDLEIRELFNSFQKVADASISIRSQTQGKRMDVSNLFTLYDEFWVGFVTSAKDKDLTSIELASERASKLKPQFESLKEFINAQFDALKLQEKQLENLLLIAKDLSEPISEGLKANIKRVQNIIKEIFDETELKRLEIYFYYDENMGKFFLYNNLPKKIKGIKLSKNTGLLLGFDIDEDGLVKGLRMRYNGGYAKYTPDISLGIHHMFVYMPDIIEPTYVGDRMAQVLRIVNVDKLKKIDEVYTIEDVFPVEYHHRVVKKRISHIRIQLRTAYGNLLKFSWGAVILTLHFKRLVF